MLVETVCVWGGGGAGGWIACATTARAEGWAGESHLVVAVEDAEVAEAHGAEQPVGAVLMNGWGGGGVEGIDRSSEAGEEMGWVVTGLAG